jgi:flagellar biosynthetic protein FliR
MSLLEEFLVGSVFAFMLTFVRIGAAVTIMPGVGDSFTPSNIRLYIALGLSVTLAPFVAMYLPEQVPAPPVLFTLLVMEFIIGLFIGTIARVFMAALDTAGMVISMMAGLGNAQVFNPGSATQGSIVGAMLSVTGVVLIFATNMHHLLFLGLVGSYDLFPIGELPDAGSMAEMLSKAVAGSFMIGVQIASPFIVLSLLVYIGMGVLTRLMPQIQVFLLALPLQILLSILTLALVVSAGLMFWLAKFEEGMIFFLSGG